MGYLLEDGRDGLAGAAPGRGREVRGSTNAGGDSQGCTSPRPQTKLETSAEMQDMEWNLAGLLLTRSHRSRRPRLCCRTRASGAERAK